MNNFKQKETGYLINIAFMVLISIASLFFFLSDLMLPFNNFANMPKIYDIICIALYYPAEFLLAFSIFLIGFNSCKTKENINEKNL